MKNFASRLILAVFYIQEVWANKDCIRTLHDFQMSLVKRSVNLDSLSSVFSPPNHQASISFTVHYHFCSNFLTLNSTAKVLCYDMEQWADDKNAGRHPVKDFSEGYSYKFLWNASPMNVFIRPKLLSSLSLYTFRIQERTTHIILDQLCEALVSPTNRTNETNLMQTANSSIPDSLNDCKNPPPILVLLEKLTAGLRSFYLHKQSFFTQGIRGGGNEQGYPTYYFDPDVHTTDVCVLKQFNDYIAYRYILAAAIFLTQILIPIVIPFAARPFYPKLKKCLEKDESDNKHYLRGFIITLVLLCACVFTGNVYIILTEEIIAVLKSGVGDVHMYYIAGGVIMCIVNPINLTLNIWYNSKRMHKICCHPCCGGCKCCMTRCDSWGESWFTFSVCILVITANFLAFNTVYIFMSLIAAPIATGSLIFLYFAVFFLLTMFFTLLSKGWSFAHRQLFSSNLPTSTTNRRGTSAPQNTSEQEKLLDSARNTSVRDHLLWCDVGMGLLIAVLLVLDMGLYLVFYYLMAVTVEPYSSSAGFLSSFGSLVPAIFTLTAGMLEKRLINFLSSSDNKEEKNSTDQPTQPNYGATNA